MRPLKAESQNGKSDIVQFCRSIPGLPPSQWEGRVEGLLCVRLLF